MSLISFRLTLPKAALKHPKCILNGWKIGALILSEFRWEFDGSFGLLNSGRNDVDYENFQGQKPDRKLLTLLQKV